MYQTYLLGLEKKSYEEAYEIFHKKYSGNLKSFIMSNKNIPFNIYDINDVAITLEKSTDKDSLKHFGNINFLGTKDLIDKTINDIKSKGFKLEEIK